jgi:L-aminopeptidase/D-esterase-like protein
MATELPHDSLTDVPGFQVGHATDLRGRTGCTVILCGDGAVPGIDVRGSASGLRDVGPCDPAHLVPVVHALFLSGGSAFGLDAAAGVMTWLEKRRIGFRLRGTVVPIVPAAILFDLSVGNPRARPTTAMAARACRAASSRSVEQGCFGAGTGASVGKLFGMARAMKSGLGSASVRRGPLRVGALAAVNAWGDVIDPLDGRILAGLRDSARGSNRIGMTAALADAPAPRRRGPGGRASGGRRQAASVPSNTTLGVVATNARLTKTEAGLVARMAHAAFARCIAPTHTRYDGDVVFCLSRGRVRADPERVGVLAIEAMQSAITRAVLRARGLTGLPAAADLDGRG